MVLSVTYPWAPASSYLSSQSVADSRRILAATLMPPRGHACLPFFLFYRRFFILRVERADDCGLIDRRRAVFSWGRSTVKRASARTRETYKGRS